MASTRADIAAAIGRQSEADSDRAAADAIVKAAKERVAVAAKPLAPGHKFLVRVRGAVNLNRAAADGQTVFEVPVPKPAPPGRDTARVRPAPAPSPPRPP